MQTSKTSASIAVGATMVAPRTKPATYPVDHGDSGVIYLEIGDRSPGDAGSYRSDDLQAIFGADGAWPFTHKDATPF